MAKPKKPTRRPHYVPAWYLRNFTAGGRFFGFDKKKANTFHANPKDVGAERDFYAPLGGEPGEEPPSELMLKAAEDECKKSFDRVLGRIGSGASVVKLDDEDRIHLALHVVLQHARTPLARQAMVQRRDALFEWTKEFYRGERGIDLSGVDPAKNPIDVRTVHTERLFGRALVEHAHRVASWSFLFVHNTTGVPFYTSDHPAIQEDFTITESAKLPFAMPAGMEPSGELQRLVPGLSYFLPMSSQVMLVIAGGEKGGAWPDFDGRVELASDADVRGLRRDQVIVSLQQVYCARDEFDEAREVIAKSPRLADPDRRLVEARSVDDTFAEAEARRVRIQGHAAAARAARKR